MIKNYLKIAFRNLLRHRVFSAINLAGLAIGMSSFLLIAVLTEAGAKKYFGSADPMGRTLVLDGKYNIRITGFLEAIYEKSCF